MLAYMVADWLESIGYVGARPVRVTIRRGPRSVHTFQGAETLYPNIGQYDANYTRDHALRLYLPCNDDEKLMDIPRRLFVMSNQEWIIAAHMHKIDIPGCESYHPFGANMILCKWMHPTKVDHYDKTPYKRFPMELEYLDN